MLFLVSELSKNSQNYPGKPIPVKEPGWITMKLRIQADEVELSQALRTSIDSHFRIALGSRSGRFRSARITFARGRNGVGQVCCRISVRAPEGLSESVEETAPDLETAMEWAIWRLIHSLDRQALRTAGAPAATSRPASSKRS